MRIAVVTSDRQPNVGGGYTFEQEICDSLSKIVNDTHHELFIVAREGWQQTINNPAIGFIPNTIRYYKGPLKWLQKKLKYKTNLDKQFKENNIDLVWFIGATADFDTELPYICNVWDVQHRKQPYFPEVSKLTNWEKRNETYARTLQRATKIIVGNKTSRDEITLYYQIASERICIVPQMTPAYALNQEALNPNIAKQYGLPDTYLFYPAQLWPHKNHVNLLHALKILHDEFNIHIPLVLVGSDQGNSEYIKQTINSLSLEKQVYLLGYVSQVDLIALYQNAFALTYVSLFGPENLPPLEAMALGCPVIAMDVPGMKEQLGERALYAQPGNVKSIAMHIRDLYQDKQLREKLIEKGLAEAGTWTGVDFVTAVLKQIDEFEYYRRCWD